MEFKKKIYTAALITAATIASFGTYVPTAIAGKSASIVFRVQILGFHKLVYKGGQSGKPELVRLMSNTDQNTDSVSFHLHNTRVTPTEEMNPEYHEICPCIMPGTY